MSVLIIDDTPIELYQSRLISYCVTVLEECFLKNPEIKIEAAEGEDLDEILALVNVVNKEKFIEIIPQEHWYEPFLTRKQLDHMATFMEFYIFRKVSDIVAVGSFGIRDNGIPWIPLMYVRSDLQRRGIGSAFMVYLEQLAREAGHTRVQLETDLAATWAVSFYERHGYVIIEKIENPWGYNIWMEKGL